MPNSRPLYRFVSTGDPGVIGTVNFPIKIDHQPGRSFAEDVNAYLDKSGGLEPGVYLLCHHYDDGQIGIGLLFHITEAGEFVQGVTIGSSTPSVTHWPPRY
jgi:hypothetical protein